MTFRFKGSYVHRYDGLDPLKQRLIVEAEQEIKRYFETGRASYGLRITQVAPKVFEARATRALRIVWHVEGDLVTFALLGNHDEVRRFLRRL